MGSSHARHMVWLLGWALALGGCRAREPGPAPGAAGTAAATATTATAETAAPARAPAPVFADIAADLAPLRARFQEDDGLVRVIMLVAPT